MPSQAIRSHGTLLQIGDGASPTEHFTSVAEVMDITGPALTKSILDTTNQVTSLGWKEALGGLKDGGAVSFTCNYIIADPTQAFTSASTAALGKDWLANTRRDFQMIFTNVGLTQWLFGAIVKDLAVDAKVDGVLQLKVALQITGPMTLV
jgi:predicted secreted protein